MHLTETCDPQMPLIITSVSTTPATTTDGEMTSVIHEQLADKECLPNVHGVVRAYTTADNLADAAELDVDLCLLSQETPVGKPVQSKDSIFLILKLIGPVKRRLAQTAFSVEAGVRALIRMVIPSSEFTFLAPIVCLV